MRRERGMHVWKPPAPIRCRHCVGAQARARCLICNGTGWVQPATDDRQVQYQMRRKMGLI